MQNLNTIMTHWETWQTVRSLATHTIQERRRLMTKLITTQNCHPINIAAADIIDYLKQDFSKATRHTYYSTISAYCTWLVQSGKRLDNPIDRVPAPKRPKKIPRPITSSQLNSMLNLVNRKRTKAMILLAALAGMRVHEIAKIKGQDIDLQEQTLIIEGKGDKTAIIPLHPKLALEATKWPQKGYWFPSYTKTGHIHSKSVSAAISRVMSKAGIEVPHPHRLRHYYGTKLLQRCDNIRIVQELMRHESIASTAIYTQVSLEQQRTALSGLHIAA